MQTPHRFKIGDQVQFTPYGGNTAAPRRPYKITRLLPAVGDDNQYRIQSVEDGHERVVKENEID
jgi:hypothetical protein